MKKTVRKAIIPAAGLGTRFLPATKSQPKEMLPIVDKPTLQYIIEEAIESGIEEILIVTGRSKKSIEDHFDRSVELELELEQKGKKEMLKILDERHAFYPAEHNVGHLYLAAPALIKHYKKNDPTNSFNPGVGKQTMSKYWGEY